jgi:hypothetical protein
MGWILIFSKYINNIFRLGFVLESAGGGLLIGFRCSFWMVEGQGKGVPDLVLARIFSGEIIRDADFFMLV